MKPYVQGHCSTVWFWTEWLSIKLMVKISHGLIFHSYHQRDVRSAPIITPSWTHDLCTVRYSHLKNGCGGSQNPELTQQKINSLPVHLSGTSFIFGKNDSSLICWLWTRENQRHFRPHPTSPAQLRYGKVRGWKEETEARLHRLDPCNTMWSTCIPLFLHLL